MVYSIIKKNYFEIFESKNLPMVFFLKVMNPLTNQSASQLKPLLDNFKQNCLQLKKYSSAQCKSSPDNEQQKQQQFRYLISMIYNILKKDKSSLLTIFDQFLYNKRFIDAPTSSKYLSLDSEQFCKYINNNTLIDNSEIICSFNNYLSLINNKKSNKLTCLFDEWDENSENKILKNNLSEFERLLTSSTSEAFQNYLMNDCRSLLKHYLENYTTEFDSQMKNLLMSLKLNKFQGKLTLTRILKLTNEIKLKNPREIISILAYQHGVILQENLLTLVLDVYLRVSSN